MFLKQTFFKAHIFIVTICWLSFEFRYTIWLSQQHLYVIHVKA
jgi:hypothetical protein